MARKKNERTFEGTSRKAGAFEVTTSLTNSEAVTQLRAMGNDFASDCADHIELMEMGETRKLPVKYRANLVAWGFRLIDDVVNRIVLTLPASITERVRYRKPMAFAAAGDLPVHIRQCGPDSKHEGKYQITDGTGFGGAFYGFASPDGEWSPTRATPKAVVEAIKNFG